MTSSLSPVTFVSKGFRRDVQGLRAIAVLAVVVFHYDSNWLSGGFVGVDIFLVISGFLITDILLRNKAAPDYALGKTVKRFYLNRILRIVPAYYALLLSVAVASSVLFTVEDYAYFSESLKAALIFNSNHFFARFGDYFAPAVHEQPLIHTWSLAIEMQFYLLMPFLVLLVSRNVLKWLMPLSVITLLLLADWMLRVMGEQQSTFYALYARVPEFLAGSLLALFALGSGWSLKLANRLWLLGLVVVMGSMLVIDGDLAFPGLLSIPPVLGAVLMIAGGHATWSTLMSGRLVVWLGALSYSLYLWHWPVLSLIRYLKGRSDLNLVETVVFVLATLLAAALSYYVVEQSFYRKKTGVFLPTWSKAGIAVMGLIFLPVTPQALSSLNQQLAPPPLPVEQTRYADQEEICHGHWVNDCLRGDKQSSRQVLVLGDSHAAMLNYFFDALGKDLAFSARVITASNCVTFPGYDWSRLARWAQKPCEKQIAKAQTYLPTAETTIIAGKWTGRLRQITFAADLRAFLANSHARIYLLAQVPEWRLGPQRIRRLTSLGLPAAAEEDEAYLRANQTIRALADEFPHVTYVDTTGLPMFDDLPIHHGKLMYLDTHHLNEVGALVYATQVKSLIQTHVNANHDKQ